LISCKQCAHRVLCVVRKQMEQNTMLPFPDGKVALVDLEASLVSCDYFLPMAHVGMEVPRAPDPPALQGFRPVGTPQWPGQMSQVPQDDADTLQVSVPQNEAIVYGGPGQAPQRVAFREGSLLAPDPGAPQVPSKKIRIKLSR